MYRLASATGETSRAAEMRAHIEYRMVQIETESTLQILPLRKLVAVQVGSGFLALNAIASDY